jgi:UDP:flavonoid glycosyltransferase YjiC (YdhE family)
MYATIHHGGSGTLHTSLRAGCASMVIPHLGDQFIFDQMAFRAGVGPRGIRISKLEKAGLKKKILDLLHNPVYKTNAEKIAAKMAAEDMEDEVYEFVLGGSSD